MNGVKGTARTPSLSMSILRKMGTLYQGRANINYQVVSDDGAALAMKRKLM